MDKNDDDHLKIAWFAVNLFLKQWDPVLFKKREQKEWTDAANNEIQIWLSRLELKCMSTTGEDALTKKTLKGVHLAFFQTD